MSRGPRDSAEVGLKTRIRVEENLVKLTNQSRAGGTSLDLSTTRILLACESPERSYICPADIVCPEFLYLTMLCNGMDRSLNAFAVLPVGYAGT